MDWDLEECYLSCLHHDTSTGNEATYCSKIKLRPNQLIVLVINLHQIIQLKLLDQQKKKSYQLKILELWIVHQTKWFRGKISDLRENAAMNCSPIEFFNQFLKRSMIDSMALTIMTMTNRFGHEQKAIPSHKAFYPYMCQEASMAFCLGSESFTTMCSKLTPYVVPKQGLFIILSCVLIDR